MTPGRRTDQTEAEVTKAIRSTLKTLGVFHWKVHQGLGSVPGVPDILGCYKGKLLGIEVKTRRGTLSDHQRRFIDQINREGGIAFVARSIDDVIAGLGVENRFLPLGQGVRRER